MIYLGTDHRGFALKEKIKGWLADWGYQFEDLGNTVLDPDDDYPDFVSQVARRVAEDPHVNKGIFLSGSGQGEAIVANKFKGIRAAVYYGGPDEVVALSREHNDSNVLSLGVALGSTFQGSKSLDEETVKRVVKLWLETPGASEPRHLRRLEKIRAIEG